MLLTACGGGDGARVSKIDNGFSVEGGIAQKGPMAAGSKVSIDELISSTFASAGASYNLQTTGDLGTFDTSALRISRQYIKTYVSGYYRNEMTGLLANDQVTLMAYSDLDVDRLVNVNLLTTLAGPRIEKLVQDKTSTSTYRKFSAARTQAQKEVLAAFRIYNSTDLMPGGTDSTKNIVAGNFNELDLSTAQTSSQILAALSAVAVKAGSNGAGISEFIADFQADLAADGLINQAAVRSQISAASDTMDMAVVATNLKTFFPTTTVTAALLSPWIDSSSGVDLVIDKYKSTASGTSGTETQSVAYDAGADDVGQCFSASAGKLYKGTTATFTPATANLVTGTVKATAADFFKIGLTGATGQTSGFIQRSAQVTTGTGASSVSACPTAVPTTNVTRVAMYSRTNTGTLLPQATLVAAAGATSLAASAQTTLSTSGGSGNGAITYAVASGSCTISGNKLTAASAAGSCTVTATKAANNTYSAATSAAITITVTTGTSSASTTFVTFDETTAPGLTAFGGDVGTIETDPVVSTNKAMKIVKSAGNETWAGVTISKCTYPENSLPVIPLTATNKTMSLRVYSSVANKVLRLKLENAANAAINVEMDATVTAANTWQTLTFDISNIANNSGNATRTWLATDVLNKASVFADFGNQTAVTMYVDDLTFIGTSGVSQTCMTAPVVSVPTTAPAVPTAATANVQSLYGDGYTTVTGTDTPNWGQSTVVSTQTYASNNLLKLATFGYQGVVTAAALDVSSHTSLHIDFWSETATTIEVKLVSLSPTLETSVFIPVAAGTWTSKDIPMSSFTAPDKSKFQQLILAAAVNGGTLYVDNIYFWK